MTQEWTWQPAAGPDVPAIKDIAVNYFECEVQGIWIPDHIAYMRNITQAIVNQFYTPGSELILVAKDVNDVIVGYMWVRRGQRSPWSDEEMAMVQMVHVDMRLSLRRRIQLISEMIANWETWCLNFGIPIVCSTTMRDDQAGFLRIHQHCGYVIRGSYAYKRLSGADMAGSADSHDALDGKQQNIQVSPTPPAA